MTLDNDCGQCGVGGGAVELWKPGAARCSFNMRSLASRWKSANSQQFLANALHIAQLIGQRRARSGGAQLVTGVDVDDWRKPCACPSDSPSCTARLI